MHLSRYTSARDKLGTTARAHKAPAFRPGSRAFRFTVHPGCGATIHRH